MLDAARVHLTAAEHEEQKVRQKQELARQMAIAEEARRKAEEQRKFQVKYSKLLHHVYNFGGDAFL